MENPMKQLNIMQIQELIPHRHPFLLIDGCLLYTSAECFIKGQYGWAGSISVCSAQGTAGD